MAETETGKGRWFLMAKIEDSRVESGLRPDREYMEDKPEDCANCYWWKPGKKCCAREECYYLLSLKEENGTENTLGDCRFCPYGKFTPCIGFCLTKLLHSDKQGGK